jgi:hypothetical protein
MKFRKKPVVIEAIQYNGLINYVGICEFVSMSLGTEPDGAHPALIIPTLEGHMRASKGDWIIKGVNGEFYPCKPDIFEKTYEPADEQV